MKWVGFLGSISFVLAFLYFFFAIPLSVFIPLGIAVPVIYIPTLLIIKYTESEAKMEKHAFSSGADLISEVRGDKIVLGVIGGFLVVLYLFLTINVPELFGQDALIYAVLAMWAVTAPLLLVKFQAVGFLGPLGTDKKGPLSKTFLISAGATALWTAYGAAISFIAPSSLSVPTLSEQRLLVMVNVMWVLTAAISEEFFFRSTEGAWFCNVMGIVPGALLTGVVFAGFHWAVYQTVAVAGVFLFVMGSFVMLLDVHRKSAMPGLMVHVINNVNAVSATVLGASVGGISVGIGVGAVLGVMQALLAVYLRESSEQPFS